MDIFLGPFHPNLEDALARAIRTERERDLLAPILVLVPSDLLRRRIKTLLAAEHAFPLLNFRVQTFFQLTLILLQEAEGSRGIVVRDDTFMEEALRRVVAAQESSLSFIAMMENDGACAALWQTLRDLKDGAVDPEMALEALDEGHFEQHDEAGLRELFTVYREVRAHFGAWGARDYGDLDARAEPLVGSSSYLAQFARIYYYGFYDLTQYQLDLFRSVARNFLVTLFYPLIPGHGGWAFAEEFYVRHLRGLAGPGAVTDLTREGHGRESGLRRGIFAEEHLQPTETLPDLRVVSCSGTRDEVAFVAKETLRLVEEEGLEFDQVGVIARTLDAYVPWLEETFPEHGIPFNTSAREPLLLFNLVKALLLLVDLPLKEFPRAQVIDLLASPYFKLPRRVSPDRVEPRPEVWDVLTRALRITRGLSEWRRLEHYVESGLNLGLVNEEEGKPLRVAPEQVRMLLGAVRNLDERLNGLPREGTWSHLSDRWLEVIHEFIRLDRDGDHRLGAVRQVLDEIFSGLAQLETVSARTSLAYFTGLLRKKLARASVPVSAENVLGVHFLDAMSARGMPFRALFLLGMNEGVFPRPIREDPFLRDRARRVLETDLGCKVSEKLRAYDEEKLLLSLLVGSAGERLYFMYQRSDSAGRPLAPSWYLDEIQRVVRVAGGNAGVVAIPRGIRGKESVAPFDDPAWMLPSEIAVRRTLRSEDPKALIPLFGVLPETYERGVETIRALENRDAPAGPLDGLTGTLPDLWERIAARGISPTNLETYARCPFQYFARYGLRLERLERPELLPILEPVEMGKICHEILRHFYDRGGPQLFRMSPAEWHPLFEEAVAQVISAYERESPTGYPVEWEVLKEELTDLILQAVHADLDELAVSSFRPVACEKELGTQFGSDWPDEVAGLPVHGRVDRIDQDTGHQRLRVVDYKFKRSRNPGARDRDLVRSAVRGMQLQPPIYTLLGADYAAGRQVGLDRVEAAFYFIAPEWDEGPLVIQSFPGGVWAEPTGAGIRQTIAQILKGIREGEYFILPGEYCRFCEVSEICRKAHLPSLTRAARHAGAQKIMQMRKQGGTAKRMAQSAKRGEPE